MPTTTDCAVVLLPQIEIQNRSREVQNAWLNLITEATFETIKRSAGIGSGANAGLPISGIPAQFSGFFNGSYEDFQEKRRNYLSLEAGDFSEATTEALFRQSLTGEQLQAWTACVTQNRVGLVLMLFDDNAASVTADVFYSGTPGSRVRVDVTITNGSVQGRSRLRVHLVSGGNQRFNVTRSAVDADIKVIANSRTLAASAVSIWPLPIPPVLPPVVNIHDHTGVEPDLISQGRPTTTSNGGGGAAVDGDPVRNWNAQGFPPQWIEIQLDGKHDIDRIVLIPEQTPSGVGRHIITGRRPTGEQVVIDEHSSFTGSGSQITVLAENNKEGWDITSVRIDTVSLAPLSWVSWREIQIYGWKL